MVCILKISECSWRRRHRSSRLHAGKTSATRRKVKVELTALVPYRRLKVYQSGCFFMVESVRPPQPELCIRVGAGPCVNMCIPVSVCVSLCACVHAVCMNVYGFVRPYGALSRELTTHLALLLALVLSPSVPPLSHHPSIHPSHLPIVTLLSPYLLFYPSTYLSSICQLGLYCIFILAFYFLHFSQS